MIFANLVEEHRPALLTRAVKLCADRARADDLVQDTFERALRRFTTFVPGTNARAWLMTIMSHLFVDQLHRLKGLSEISIADRDDIAGEPPAEELRVTPQQLHATIAALPKELRQVIVLKLQGLSYRDIARQLGIPENTVGTRLFRARTELRAMLRAILEAR